ncbi:MAG: SIMPL domain-containing protein [Sphingomonas bacterium]|nr:SIMPL domain-containing protein [Sphingomonas bacterium]
MQTMIQGNRAILLGSVGIFSAALVASGYLLGDGLRRAKSAERSISVRGVSERDVTADLATWTISFSQEGPELGAVNARVEQQSAAVRRFFATSGFKSSDISDSGVSFSRTHVNNDEGQRVETRVTVTRSVQLRTAEVMKVRSAQQRLPALLRDGVELDGSNLSFNFTGLNQLKPEMIAEATKRARGSAEQFARDSGAHVGSIRTASQGYFSVGPRDGSEGEEGSANGSPFQKVRVVTSVDYDIAV